jgi:phosphonopyruvate decarboxylase
VSFGEIAAACGYVSALETDDVSRLKGWLEDNAPGPHFARMLVRPGTPQDLPRPSIGPVEVKTRWQRHFAALGCA